MIFRERGPKSAGYAVTRLLLIQALCPTCGSGDVFYSCHVTCCFNHVCNACRATFELATKVTGKREGPFEVPADRDTSLPMAPCAACGKADVFQEEGAPGLVCASCHSLLALEYEKVVAGG